MAAYDFRAPRLHVEAALASGATIALAPAQTNYLINVLRLSAGDGVLVFNGQDGEWRASLAKPSKKVTELRVGEQTRPQTVPTDIHYLFAPLKHARLDYMVQKAVEMGASRLQPVLSRHSQPVRVNLVRMRANAIEAAEQCGILNLPEIGEAAPLMKAIAELEDDRLLIFCDEEADVANPVEALARVRPDNGKRLPLAVLIGPEGGFAEEERRALIVRPQVVRISLGPRILRADTAAVASLALVGAMLGDWQ